MMPRSALAQVDRGFSGPSSPSKILRPAVRRSRRLLGLLAGLIACCGIILLFVSFRSSLQWLEVDYELGTLPHEPQPQLPSHRLLLASHNRLSWYLPDKDELLVIHEGEVRLPPHPLLSS